jgi:hypothetical protein
MARCEAGRALAAVGECCGPTTDRTQTAEREIASKMTAKDGLNCLTFHWTCCEPASSPSLGYRWRFRPCFEKSAGFVPWMRRVFGTAGPVR